MGKFSDALKKSETSRRKQLAGEVVEKLVQIPQQEVKGRRLDTEAPEAFNQPSWQSPGKLDPCLVSLFEPNTPAAECFKILRAKLLFSQKCPPCKAIMVTSPQPCDGKTVVAANLAVSIARGLDEHVLLVDCDLRSPKLHKSFDLEVHRGLREYLEDGNSLSPYLVKTPVEKLTLLPAGEIPANPSELLSSEKMRNLIGELKARYQDRYVIVDTPPAQFTPEGSFMASMLDGVLLIARSGKTSRELLVQLAESIGRDKILGVVFNASNGSNGDRRFIRGYYQ
jgi:capsular exopolysaccharide synthesis family protein